MNPKFLFLSVYFIFSQIQPAKAQVIKASRLETVNSQVLNLNNEFLFPVPQAITGSHISFKVLKGKPFADIQGTVYFNPADYLTCDTIRDHSSSRVSIQSLRFYLDTSSCKIGIHQFEVNGPIQYELRYNFNKNYSSFFYPFYFKKYEVTNKEYRQFTTWVRDSIARTQLAAVFPEKFLKDTISKRLNWKTSIGWGSKNPQIREILDFIYWSAEDQFFGRKCYNTNKFIYTYTDLNNLIKSVAVYPDTLCYYDGSSNGTYVYFSNTKFDDYPVIGVNFYQAKAFCNWKNQQLHSSVNQQACNFEFEIDIPNENEWEYVTSRYNCENGEQTMADFSCVTDLIMDDSLKSLPYILNSTINGNLQQLGGSSQDGFRWIHKADIGTIKGWRKNTKLAINRDENGISGMGDNVSEWMNESYQDNWKPYLQKRNRMLSSIHINLPDSAKTSNKDRFISFDQGVSKDTIYLYDKILNVNTASTSVRPGIYFSEYLPTYYENFSKRINCEIPLVLGIEKFYDDRSDKDGQLVRGGNWFDERYSVNCMQDIPQRNFAGINAKTFVSRSKSSNKIGFRYVIRIKQKI